MAATKKQTIYWTISGVLLTAATAWLVLAMHAPRKAAGPWEFIYNTQLIGISAGYRALFALLIAIDLFWIVLFAAWCIRKVFHIKSGVEPLELP